jgi:tetratricopeptide (TPR) repeat protein
VQVAPSDTAAQGDVNDPAQVLNEVRRLVAAGTGGLGLWGPAGIGLTTLVGRVLEGNPRPSLAVDLAGVAQPAALQAALRQALPEGWDQSLERWWEAHAAEGACLWFDHVDRPPAWLAAWLQGWLQTHGRQGVVIVCARAPLPGGGVPWLPLGGLPQPQALTLLRARCQALGLALDPLTPGLPDLLAWSEGNPRLLVWLASRLVLMSPLQLLTRLREASVPFSPLHPAWQGVIATLDETARALIDALAAWPGPLPLEMLEAMVEAPPEALADALLDLRGQGLVTPVEPAHAAHPRRWAMVPGLRSALPPAPAHPRTAAAGAVLARRVVAPPLTGITDTDTGAWLIDHANLLHALHHLATGDLRDALRQRLLERADLARLEATVDSLAVSGPELPDAAPEASVQTLHQRALEALAAGHLPQARALLERALQRARPLDDARLAADLHRAHAHLLASQGRWDDAVAAWRQVLDQVRALHDTGEQARALRSLGKALARTGRWDDALQAQQAALDLTLAGGSRRQQHKAALALGETLLEAGRHPELDTLVQAWLPLAGPPASPTAGAWSWLGARAALEAGQGEAARAWLAAARAGAPPERADALTQADALAGALHADRVHDGSPDPALPPLWRALWLARAERWDDALDLLADHLARHQRTAPAREAALLHLLMGLLGSHADQPARARAALATGRALLALVPADEPALPLLRALASWTGERVEDTPHDPASVASARQALTCDVEAPPWRIALAAWPLLDLLDRSRQLSGLLDPGLRSLADRLDARAWDAALVVESSLAWVRRPGCAREWLPSRALARRLLVPLLEARLQTPGQPVPAPVLVEAGWPGEAMVAGSAANRLHVAIRRLRDSGWGDLLCSSRSGYWLDPTVALCWGGHHSPAVGGGNAR